MREYSICKLSKKSTKEMPEVVISQAKAALPASLAPSLKVNSKPAPSANSMSPSRSGRRISRQPPWVTLLIKGANLMAPIQEPKDLQARHRPNS